MSFLKAFTELFKASTKLIIEQIFESYLKIAENMNWYANRYFNGHHPQTHPEKHKNIRNLIYSPRVPEIASEKSVSDNFLWKMKNS